MKLLLIVIIYTLITLSVYSRDRQQSANTDGSLDKHCRKSLTLKEIINKVGAIKTPRVDFYVFPPKINKDHTGCQNVWLPTGHKLLTKYYNNGVLIWIRGQEPNDNRSYFCVYKNRQLQERQSTNIKLCPLSAK